MLPRGLRVNFNDTKEFWRIFCKTPEFLIKTRPFPAVRFAVTVGVKVDKKSSRRNLLKRMVKGIILRNLESFKNSPVKDYWIRLLPPANNLDKKEFEMKLRDILFNQY